MAEPFHVAPAARAELLAAAHDAIDHVVLRGRGEEEDPPGGEAPCAAVYDVDGVDGLFVSLHVGGTLRGCLGTWELDRSLERSVRRMAAAAATRDNRFPPLGADELAEVEVEISLVGTPHPTSSPQDWRLGEHGLTVSRGKAHGVLLPQVALTHHLDRRGFLEATCAKAGLARDAWRDPKTQVMAFEAEFFGD